MELTATMGRDGALDREAGELVAEGDRAAAGFEHAGGDAFVEMPRLLREGRLEQPEFDARGHERRALEEASGRAPKAWLRARARRREPSAAACCLLRREAP